MLLEAAEQRLCVHGHLPAGSLRGQNREFWFQFCPLPANKEGLTIEAEYRIWYSADVTCRLVSPIGYTARHRTTRQVMQCLRGEAGCFLGRQAWGLALVT